MTVLWPKLYKEYQLYVTITHIICCNYSIIWEENQHNNVWLKTSSPYSELTIAKPHYPVSVALGTFKSHKWRHNTRHYHYEVSCNCKALLATSTVPVESPVLHRAWCVWSLWRLRTVLALLERVPLAFWWGLPLFLEVRSWLRLWK